MRMAVENDVKNDNADIGRGQYVLKACVLAGSERRYERGAIDKEAKAIYSCKRHHNE